MENDQVEIQDSATSDVPEVKPEVPETPSAPETAEPEKPDEDSEPQTEDTSDEPPKKSKGVQKRIDELVRQREEYRALFEQERQEKMRMFEMAQRPTPPEFGKPDISQFDDHDKYLEALADWKVESRLAEERQKQSEREQAREAARRQSLLRERIEKASERYEDFYESARADVNVSAAVADAITDSELGADLIYFLGKNPEEARRLNALNPVAAVREVGRLEARIQEANKPKPKPISNAPDPVKPLGGKEVVSKRPEEMSMSEYIAWRRGKT